MDAREAAAPLTAKPKEKENSLCLDHVRIRQVLHVLPILERALQLDCRVGATWCHSSLFRGLCEAGGYEATPSTPGDYENCDSADWSLALALA